MKRWMLCLMAVLFVATQATAQRRASFLVPAEGNPGMSTLSKMHGEVSVRAEANTL